MISTRLYLDKRAPKATGECPIKIQINRRGQTALLSTGISVLPSQWDKASLMIIKHPSRGILNTRIAKLKIKVDDLINEMVLSGRLAYMSATEIKNEVQETLFGNYGCMSFSEFFEVFLSGRTPATQKVYRSSIARLYKFDNQANGRPLSAFSESWASKFDEYLISAYSANTRKMTIGHVGAVFNAAIRSGHIRRSPFVGIKTGFVTTRKRSLSREQFRALWNCVPQTLYEQSALDFFKFSFLTIAANPIDICSLTEDNIYNGRIEYTRAKTKKHYSIKIVDELLPLLHKYKRGAHLCRPFHNASPLNITSRVDHLLVKMGHRVGIKENVTMYWARHSWATFAAQLDIPIDIISSALGHSHGAKVTMIYVAVDMKKVDEAHRKVIDYVLYR